MTYATAEECVRTYAQLCFAFGPTARKKRAFFFVLKKIVMVYLTPVERLRVALVSVAFARGAAALKRSAHFSRELMVTDGLDRIKAVRSRFPSLEDVSVDLSYGLHAPILAKLCTFTFVTKLVLRDNDIAVLPDVIGELTNLKELWLSSNEIETLPTSIRRLTALETLNLHGNILASVPRSISSLKALTTLSLGNNCIRTLPDWICGMTTLTVLHLHKNELTRLPDTICQLARLDTLYLSNNALTSLPETIVMLTNITDLNIYDNPLHTCTQSLEMEAWLEAHDGCDDDMW